MDAATLAQAMVEARRRYVGRRRPTLRHFGDRVPVWNRLSHFGVASSTITAADSYSRLGFDAFAKINTVAVLFGNWGLGEAISQSDLTITAAIEYPVNTITPLTFRGATSVLLKPGTVCAADPLGVDIPRNARAYIRTYAVCSGTGTTLPISAYANGTGDQQERDVHTDRTLSGNAAGSATYCYGPLQVLATVEESAMISPLVACGLDSLTAGAGGAPADVGWVSKFCIDNHIPVINISQYGSKAQDFATSPNTRRRRMAMMDGCTHAVLLHGTNDAVTGTSVATMQGYLLTEWRLFWERGIKVYGCTLPPETTSTDNWATLANQTLVSSWALAGRVTQLNAWIMDGAPINLSDWVAGTSTPLAVGATTDAIRAGSTSHPLFGVLDVGGALTDAATGKWRVTGSAFGYTTDGIHPNALGHSTMRGVLSTNLFTVT